MPVDKFGRMSDLKTKDTGVSLTYINNNYVRSDGETPLTGSLDMRGNTLYNVADPVNPQDVVTKVYVDNTKGSGVIGRKTKDGVSIKENLDFLGKQKIKNLPDPVNDHDVVTKEYVDTTTEPFLKLDQTKYNTKGDIDMGDQFTVLNVKTPIDDNHIVDKKYVDEMDNLKSAFAFKNGSYYAKGDIIMKKNKLGGLREPLQDGEAATKKYVDDLQTQNVDEKGNIKFSRNINLDRNRIFSMKEPTKPSEGANKKYVDDTITKRIQEEKDNFLPQDPATKEYVDEAIKQVAGGDILVSKEGVFIKANGHYRATAPLDIDNHKMENLPDPVDDKDAVNKKYIDGIIENLTLKQGLIRENGGFNLVDSYINMNFNNIRNLGNPKHEADAVPRRFVDGEIRAVEEKIKKLEKTKHLIAVHARYCGPLKKGEYHFKFSGGNSLENCEEIISQYEDFKGSVTGFVMPHSGYIRKIICERLVFKSYEKIAGDIFDIVSNGKDLQYGNKPILFSSLGYVDREDFLKKGVEEFRKKFYDLQNLRRDILNVEFFKSSTFSFEIVKFEKSFREEGYYIEEQPEIISSVLSDTVAGRRLTFNKKNVGVGVIGITLNKVNLSLSEGDVINIKSAVNTKDIFFTRVDNGGKNFLANDLFVSVFDNFNYNFTFLIELDPL